MSSPVEQIPGATGAGDPQTDVPDGPQDDEAAGVGVVACWRPARDRRNGRCPDVLMHRIEADGDICWRLPRAVRGPEETLAQAASRALVDAPGSGTGGGRLPAGTVRLGRPLAPGTTVVDGVPTGYWAARLRDRAVALRDRFGDEHHWVSAKEARDLVGSAADREVLDVLLGHADEGLLDTRPVLVLRHAKARPRARWSHADADRPLVDLGRRQAAALGGLLECWHPDYLLSSPWRRCVDTVTPYVKASGVRLRTKAGLTESAHRTAPGKAAAHLDRVLGKGEAALLCTHRPVLGTVLRELSRRTARPARGEIPDLDPFLSPSEVLIAHVAVRPPSRSSGIVAIERHRPVV